MLNPEPIHKVVTNEHEKIHRLYKKKKKKYTKYNLFIC